MRRASEPKSADRVSHRGRVLKRAAPVVLTAAFACATTLGTASPARADGTPTTTSTTPYGIAPPAPVKHHKPPGPIVTTVTAIATRSEPIRRAARTKSGIVGTLRFYTPDDEALQTYRVITTKKVHRVWWDRIAVPMRPNGHTGWVKRSWLGPYITSHTVIVVDERKRHLYVYRYGKLLYGAPVGVGKASTQTPTGYFWVTEAFPSSNPFYGPWAFGTSDYAFDTEFPDGSIVGIHGTDQPNLIPGDPSHGCVRLKNSDILKLRKYVRIGTAVVIEHSGSSLLSLLGQ